MVKLQKGDEENATREELVLKFFAYFHDRDRFDGAVTKFLNNYMEREKDTFDVESERALFLNVVRGLHDILGGAPLLRRTTSVTPQIELEAAMVGAAEVLRDYGRLGSPVPSGWKTWSLWKLAPAVRTPKQSFAEESHGRRTCSHPSKDDTSNEG